MFMRTVLTLDEHRTAVNQYTQPVTREDLVKVLSNKIKHVNTHREARGGYLQRVTVTHTSCDLRVPRCAVCG
jgi:hypothetical protein